MKKVFVTLLSLSVLVACGKSSDYNNSPGGEIPSLSFGHQARGQYSSIINSQSFNNDYHFDFNEDSAGNINGRHNFIGVQSGYKKISGTRSGNTVNYQSVECAGDTFTGTFNTLNGNGSFSGTVCGFNYVNGTLSGMSQVR